ncbi:iron chaperone [Brevibacterium litoralis]|uniref:iron chaperone n=1 Tax=Brevibacterium litoralis TaxID=3138935 RepID=UPI0032ED3CE8
MPAPPRQSVADFLDALEPRQRPHLETLRRLSREFDEVDEALMWNQPAYRRDGMQWMLQAFKNHCSLRFSTEFFGKHKDTVTAAGYESGAGFLKIPYSKDVPEDLCRTLMGARLDDTGG